MEFLKRIVYFIWRRTISHEWSYSRNAHGERRICTVCGRHETIEDITHDGVSSMYTVESPGSPKRHLEPATA